MNRKDLILRQFNDTTVQFDANGYLNATAIAKKFGKRVNHWLSTDVTREYIKACAAIAALEQNQLVTIKMGAPATGGGTWIHPKLAVMFARWIDPYFAVWCDEQIEAIVHDQQRTPEERQLHEAIKLRFGAITKMEFEQMSFERRREQREYTWNVYQETFNIKHDFNFSRKVDGNINAITFGTSASKFRAQVLAPRMNTSKTFTRDYLPLPHQEVIGRVQEQLVNYYTCRPQLPRDTSSVYPKATEIATTERHRMERVIGRDLHELAREAVALAQAYARVHNMSPYEAIRQQLITLNYDELAFWREVQRVLKKA